MVQVNAMQQGNNFPWGKLWKKEITHKVTFFMLCVVRGNILTIDDLKRRGQVLVNRCSQCKEK